MPLSTCEIRDLGLIAYDDALDLQEAYSGEIASGHRRQTLLLLEHPHVYTFGRRAKPGNMLWSEDQLREHGVVVRTTDRGGDVTYHGPGQLVGYPLLSLGRVGGVEVRPNGGVRIPDADYVGYVRKLENCLIAALLQFGIASGTIPGLTGVWVQADVHSRCARCLPEDRRKPAKIAAIGVKVDALGISRHGFALNVAPDMRYWDGIIPCGITDLPVTSLQDLLREPPPMARVREAVVQAFCTEFGFTPVAVPA